MGVAPVPGYGMITSSNAVDIYKDKTTYDQLDPAQKHLVDRYVPQETRDEIDYEMNRGTQNAYDSGKESIEGADKAEQGKGQEGNVAATSVGGVVFAAGAAALTKLAPKLANKDGWIALGLGVATLACSIGSKVCADKFDDAYKDRVEANDAAGGTNETLDSHAEALENTMASMDEDVAAYNEQQELLTTTTNNNASTGADLQAQIMDAEAAGDADRVASLKEQLKAVGEFDYSQMQGDLEETRANLEGYNDCNAMAQGARDGGQSVSDFLKEGKPLGIVAGVNSVLLAAATVYSGLSSGMSAIGSAKSASHLDFAGSAAGMVAVGLFIGSVGVLGFATNTMRQKMSKELECGSSGKDMQDHVNSLNSMVENQQSYIDQTGEDFDASDENANELIAQGEKNAAEVVANASENYRQEKPENNENGDEEGAGNGSNNNQNA